MFLADLVGHVVAETGFLVEMKDLVGKWKGGVFLVGGNLSILGQINNKLNYLFNKRRLRF